MDHVVEREDVEEMTREEFFVKESGDMKTDPKLKLKKRIHEMRVNDLVNNFARKISMNNTERNPVDYTPFEGKVDTSENMNGFEVPNLLTDGFNVLSIINIIMMLIIASISIIFEEAMSS